METGPGAKTQGASIRIFVKKGEIKEMVGPIHWIIDRILWGTQISLFEKSGHNNLATHLYTSFSQLSPLKNLVVGYCIRLTWPRTQSLWITKPHSLLSSLQTPIPFPLWLNFCPLSVVSSNFSHFTHVTQVLAQSRKIFFQYIIFSNFKLIFMLGNWMRVLLAPFSSLLTKFVVNMLFYLILYIFLE